MYLFDIDGTLLLTGGAGSRAINAIFERRFAVSGAMDSVAAGGKTDDMILQECARAKLERSLTDLELADILQEYVPMLAEEMRLGSGFRMMPHVHACLDFVEQHQELVGIATGNIEAAARAKLDHAELSRYFHFGGYGSDSALRSELVATAIERGRALAGKQIPAHHFVVIGDTLHDIAAARSCGARVIAVATGSTSKHELASAAPDALFDTLEELPSWHLSFFAVDEPDA